jgi:ParB family chromosome partitioning protein
MELELHQLDRRYEALRTRSAKRERRLIASLSEVGQQTPIVVVRDGERWVVVDGYKRVRAAHRLGHDVVRAAEWMLGELDALVLERVMRGGEGDSAIEQGWLLRELVQRFGLGQDELGRRFDRSTSWVSRRLGLVTELPVSVQEEVRAGAIGAHAAMKYLVPLARANAADCEALGRAMRKLRPTSRQVAELYGAYMGGNAAVRERVVQEPALVLKARAELGRVGGKLTGTEELLHDLRVVSSVARRAVRRLADGALDGASPPERARAREQSHEAHFETERLVRRCDRETLGPERQENHAGSDDTNDHSSPA